MVNRSCIIQSVMQGIELGIEINFDIFIPEVVRFKWTAVLYCKLQFVILLSVTQP